MVALDLTLTRHRSWSISKGAALASARMRSVDDFITSGAAFGLQLGYLARPGESDVCGWQSLSYLLFDRVRVLPNAVVLEMGYILILLLFPHSSVRIPRGYTSKPIPR